jgi:hypothetical protein
MKRVTGFAGALLTAVGLVVVLAPGASADGRDVRVPVGVSPSGVAHEGGSARVAAGRADVPDIEWPPAGVTPPGHSADRLRKFAAEMGEHLDKAFPAAVPQATNLSWVEWGGEWAGIIEDGQDYLTTWAVYEDKIGSTGTALQIEAPGHFTTSPREFCEINQADCKAEFLADGSLLLHSVVTIEGNDRKYHIGSALHYRTDGTVVWVSAYDYDPIWDGDEGPDRDEIALTFEQLSALATDPALHL